MEKSKNSINVEGGFLFCGGWNFSKSVNVGPTLIREMRVLGKLGRSEWAEWQTFPTHYIEGIHTYKLTLQKWFLFFQIDSLPSRKKSRPCG